MCVQTAARPPSTPEDGASPTNGNCLEVATESLTWTPSPTSGCCFSSSRFTFSQAPSNAAANNNRLK